MKFEKLLTIVGHDPVFDTGLLLAGPIKPAYIRRQLSEWTKKGKLYQVRRGLYALAPPYQKVKPHPFLVANRMVIGSYVSLQAALGYYGLIPEYVPVVTSVTTRRPYQSKSPLGRYIFRHIKRDLQFGYQLLALGGGQEAYVAEPEKALLDLVYLEAGGHSVEYLSALRLQNLDILDIERLDQYAAKTKSPKLQQAARVIEQLAREEEEDYEML